MEDQAAGIRLDAAKSRLAVADVQVRARVDGRPRPALLPSGLGVGLEVLVGDEDVAALGGFPDRAEIAVPGHGVVRMQEIHARLRPGRSCTGRRIHGRQRDHPDAHAVHVPVRRGDRLAQVASRARVGDPAPPDLFQRRYDALVPVVPRVVVGERHQRHADLGKVVEHLGPGAVEEDVVAGRRAVASGPRHRDFQVGEHGVGGREDRRDGGERRVQVPARVVFDQRLPHHRDRHGGPGAGPGRRLRTRRTRRAREPDHPHAAQNECPGARPALPCDVHRPVIPHSLPDRPRSRPATASAWH